MTTVAYKAGIMACDSCWNDDGLVVSMANKILRLPSGALLGEAGDTDTREMVALFEKVKSAKGFPSRAAILATGIDYHAILVLPNGVVYDIAVDMKANDAGLFRITLPFCAVGSGKRLAIGAMAHGASAMQAVRIACQYETTCRLPVHTEPLKLPKAAA